MGGTRGEGGTGYYQHGHRIRRHRKAQCYEEAPSKWRRGVTGGRRGEGEKGELDITYMDIGSVVTMRVNAIRKLQVSGDEGVIGGRRENL